MRIQHGHSHRRAADDAPNTHVVAETRVPKKQLVRMEQFAWNREVELFEEALDPANSNPLRVDNRSGKLEVVVAGAKFKDGAHGTTITALEYTSTNQRYLVAVEASEEDEASYELLVDVDNIREKATLWVRVHDDNRPRWEKAARFAG